MGASHWLTAAAPQSRLRLRFCSFFCWGSFSEGLVAGWATRVISTSRAPGFGTPEGGQSVECFECIHILREIGEAFNSPMRTQEVLELASESITKHLNIKACHFRLLSQDQKRLEHVASFGLSTLRVTR